MRAYRSPQKELGPRPTWRGPFACGGHALHLARPQPTVSARRHRLGRWGSSRCNSRSWSRCITFSEVVFAIRTVKDAGLAHASAQQVSDDKEQSNSRDTHRPPPMLGEPMPPRILGSTRVGFGREIDRANAAFGGAPLARSLRDCHGIRPWTNDNERVRGVGSPSPAVAAHSDAAADLPSWTRRHPDQRRSWRAEATGDACRAVLAKRERRR
jgi:hypothetical protein